MKIKNRFFFLINKILALNCAGAYSGRISFMLRKINKVFFSLGKFYILYTFKVFRKDFRGCVKPGKDTKLCHNSKNIFTKGFSKKEKTLRSATADKNVHTAKTHMDTTAYKGRLKVAIRSD